MIKDNLAILYNNVNIMSNNSTAKRWWNNFEFITGNINIKMFDQKQKIKIIKN